MSPTDVSRTKFFGSCVPCKQCCGSGSETFCRIRIRIRKKSFRIWIRIRIRKTDFGPGFKKPLNYGSTTVPDLDPQPCKGHMQGWNIPDSSFEDTLFGEILTVYSVKLIMVWLLDTTENTENDFVFQGGGSFLMHENPDIVCLQETKVRMVCALN